jgi:hypothetical protein
VAEVHRRDDARGERGGEERRHRAHRDRAPRPGGLPSLAPEDDVRGHRERDLREPADEQHVERRAAEPRRRGADREAHRDEPRREPHEPAVEAGEERGAVDPPAPEQHSGRDRRADAEPEPRPGDELRRE